ncbi:single-stranded DNA-binding protein [Lysinibacillus yapensis]|uniref:Single-stranded DNA-binding protein n=1 Tax=Ureibacillus yapensis TaxID=2304605 RepID=A0A396SJ13_9BACL|nr:single-stranded DNA-binding protein [Lysinibacillus yapensis]RHW38725.1 single-stranded DNA-binding protein [Lysinibacillus yapensis]
MINRVVLVGRLTKDPELRYTPSGTANVKFTLAVNRRVKKEGQPEADFISCVAWTKTAENLANFQKKGNLIGVDGHIQTGSFEAQDGKRVYTTDVVADSIQFLERNNSQQGQQSQPNQQYGQQQQQYGQQTNYNNDPFANSGHQQQSSDDYPF